MVWKDRGMARGKREHSEQRGSTEGTSGKLTERGDEDVSAMAVLCCAMLCCMSYVREL